MIKKMGKSLQCAPKPEGEALFAYLADLACAALREEVSAAPKPGLVCPGDSGAHSDMDYTVFLAGIAALRPYFVECARLGAQLCHLAPPESMPLLRKAGLAGEKAMLAATGGANTHKGAIFSLGLLVAASSRLCVLPSEDVSGECLPLAVRSAAVAASFVPGLTARELLPLRTAQPTRKLTAGELLFLRYGTSGIRGEAESGFPSALCALQSLEQFAHTPLLSCALPQTLLGLMVQVEDSNVLWRSGPQGQLLVRRAAAQALACGGMFSPAGRAAVRAMCLEFTQRRISPGGSADLLALAVFLFKLESLGR